MRHHEDAPAPRPGNEDDALEPVLDAFMSAVAREPCQMVAPPSSEARRLAQQAVRQAILRRRLHLRGRYSRALRIQVSLLVGLLLGFLTVLAIYYLTSQGESKAYPDGRVTLHCSEAVLCRDFAEGSPWQVVTDGSRLPVGSLVVTPAGGVTDLWMPQAGVRLVCAPLSRLVLGPDRRLPVGVLEGIVEVALEEGGRPGRYRSGTRIGVLTGPSTDAQLRLREYGDRAWISVAAWRQPVLARVVMLAGAGQIWQGAEGLEGSPSWIPLAAGDGALLERRSLLAASPLAGTGWVQGHAPGLAEVTGPEQLPLQAGADAVQALASLTRQSDLPLPVRERAVATLGGLDAREAFQALLSIHEEIPELSTVAAGALVRFSHGYWSATWRQWLGRTDLDGPTAEILARAALARARQRAGLGRQQDRLEQLLAAPGTGHRARTMTLLALALGALREGQGRKECQALIDAARQCSGRGELQEVLEAIEEVGGQARELGAPLHAWLTTELVSLLESGPADAAALLHGVLVTVTWREPERPPGEPATPTTLGQRWKALLDRQDR